MQGKAMCLAVVATLSVGLINFADATADTTARYSPNVGGGAPKKLLWGDTHQHTGWSADAGAFGARLSPEDSLRFARGEEITSSSGQPVRLDRPLDFIVIADHSDGMGVIQEMRARSEEHTSELQSPC